VSYAAGIPELDVDGSCFLKNPTRKAGMAHDRFAAAD
jgi:hypothetical protein